MKSGKKSYLAQVRPSRTITSRINSKNRNRIRIEFSGSASHRPRCLPARWPESYSPARKYDDRSARILSHGRKDPHRWPREMNHRDPRPAGDQLLHPRTDLRPRGRLRIRRRLRPDRHLGMSGRGLPCRCLRFQTAKGKHNSEGNK